MNLNYFVQMSLKQLRRINQEYRNVDQGSFSAEEMQQRLEKVYADLEAIHAKMRKTVLDYHLAKKCEPEAKVGYTEEAPPQLTLFDEFAIVKVKKGLSKKRRIKVRSHVEHVFFRAAHRAAGRAREVRKNIDAGEVYPIPIAEEIEASAECIVLSAMCLEAYINGLVQDHLAELASYVERIELRAKWLLVPKVNRGKLTALRMEVSLSRTLGNWSHGATMTLLIISMSFVFLSVSAISVR